MDSSVSKIAFGVLVLFGISVASEARILHHNYWHFDFKTHTKSDGSYEKVDSYTIEPSSLTSAIGLLGEFPFDGSLPGGYDNTPIGIATNNQAVDESEHKWQNDSGQKFSVIQQRDLKKNSDGDYYIEVGRKDSEHVANMFSYALGNAAASSGVCFSNKSNIKELSNDTCSNPMFANGLPTHLNFFFTVDLAATVKQYDSSDTLQSTVSVRCQGVTLAQQGDEPFGPSFMHAFLSAINAGVAVGKSIDKLVVSDGDDGWGSLGKATVKTAKAAKTVVGWADSLHNPWWVGQFFSFSANGNFSQYLTTSSGPSTNLNQSDTRAILTCDNNYLMIVQQDTDSYDTFKAELVPYTIEEDN